MGDAPTEKKGLPPTYDKAKVERVIEELYQGKTLTSICKKEGVKAGTFLMWVKNDVDGLADRYARARQVGWELMADEMIDISDDNSGDDKTIIGHDGEEKTVCNTEWIQRTKVRADNRKWVISKRVPDFSDKKADTDASDIIAAMALAHAKLVEGLPD
jgi:hypothetical protein